MSIKSTAIPDFLCHYYEATIGPFVNLSDLSPTDAETIQAKLRLRAGTFAAKRDPDYLAIRYELETRVRDFFCQKGGRPVRQRPHYMILGSCPWLKTWYTNGRELRIPLTRFSSETVSFTYGDTFPAMRFQDRKPYRGKVFTLDELDKLVDRFGLPQDWNPEGVFGPDRYIEAQIWDDTPLLPFKNDLM